MERNRQYWTDYDYSRALLEARSFVELAAIALRVIGRMPKPIGQVCGPISTGGHGSVEKNLAIFNATIDRLVMNCRLITNGKTVAVFDQIPFEEYLFRLVNQGRETRDNYALLEKFYYPIFTSGHISHLYFIHGWESSHGSVWEHKLGRELEMKISYLPRDFVDV